MFLPLATDVHLVDRDGSAEECCALVCSLAEPLEREPRRLLADAELAVELHAGYTHGGQGRIGLDSENPAARVLRH